MKREIIRYNIDDNIELVQILVDVSMFLYKERKIELKNLVLSKKGWEILKGLETLQLGNVSVYLSDYLNKNEADILVGVSIERYKAIHKLDKIEKFKF